MSNLTAVEAINAISDVTGLETGASSALAVALAAWLATQKQSIPVTSAGQAVYTAQPYTPGLINVYVVGIRLNPSQYIALDGATITITDSVILVSLVVGMTVDVDCTVTLNTSNTATVASVQALDPANQAAIGTLTGTELISARQGTGLFASTLTKIASWIINTYQGFTQTGTGAIARPLQTKLRDLAITPQDFGAKGNGTVGQNVGADDTAALQAWLNALSPAVAGYLPPGVYNVSATLTKAAATYISIKTAGTNSVIFNYIGSSTAIDILSLGDPTKSATSSYWNVGGFTVESATKMTSGAAVHIQKFMVYSYFEEIACGTLTNNGNLYHGAWLDLVNVFHLPTISVTKVQADGLRCNGSASDDSGSDIFLTRGNISFCANGLHQGGGMGGLRTGQLNSFANGINYLFDNGIVARLNREVFYEPGSVCDGASVAGIVFNDTLTSNAPVSLEGFIGSSGQLVSGAGPYHGVWIKSWPAGRIAVKSAELFNHLGNGIQKDDQSCILTISPDTHLFNNTGYAVAAHAADGNIYYSGGYVANNGAGNFDTNCQLANGNTFTPVLTTSTGALTTYSATLRWTKINKLVTFTMYMTITTVGTGAGQINATLPFQVRQAVVVTGMDIGSSGKALHGFINSNSSSMSINNFDNSFPAASGSVLVISGTCEVA